MMSSRELDTWHPGGSAITYWTSPCTGCSPWKELGEERERNVDRLRFGVGGRLDLEIDVGRAASRVR